MNDSRMNESRQMNWAMPTIDGIQRVTALLILIGTAATLALVSFHAASAFAIGGVVMMGNLYLLALIGKAISGLAQGGGGAAIGVVIAPFKLLLLAGVVYLLIVYWRIDLIGFALGSLTQFAAIFIETGRVSLRAAHHAEEH